MLLEVACKSSTHNIACKNSAASSYITVYSEASWPYIPLCHTSVIIMTYLL